MRAQRVAVVVLLTCVSQAGLARAQGLPYAPLSFAEGRLVFGGEVTATVGARDDLGFFNYTDYEHNALRLFRLALSGEWRPADRFAVVGEVRTENVERVRPYALYVRVRPWRGRRIDIQAGRIPPVFGSFGRRAYSNDNPLIGYPLAYQYLTSLRADALPATADDLLRMRARGWRTNYPLGSAAFAPGLPLVSAFSWDTGVEVRVAARGVEVAGAVTNGTLSNPRVSDDNGGKQISARVAVRPVVGLALGASAARGPYLSDAALDAVGAVDGGRFVQRALGADAEYSRDHWLVRAELVWSDWRLPAIATPAIDHPLAARAVWVEGRYRLTPRVFVAGRADRLDFSKLRGTLFGGPAVPWDAPVVRTEAGGGWYFTRSLVGRAVWQRNWRDGGRQRHRSFVSGQLLYWF
jgi:hypothetical protein